MIHRIMSVACPGCGYMVRKPYLASFRAGSVRRLYECPACGKKFVVKRVNEGENQPAGH